MKVLDILLKILMVLAGVVIIAVQSLAVYALVHYNRVGAAFIAALGVATLLLLAGLVLYFALKKHRLPGLICLAAGSLAVVITASLLTREGLEQAVFYRNHLIALILPVLTLLSFFVDRAVRKSAERWRQEHLNPEQSVLLGNAGETTEK